MTWKVLSWVERAEGCGDGMVQWTEDDENGLGIESARKRFEQDNSLLAVEIEIQPASAGGRFYLFFFA